MQPSKMKYSHLSQSLMTCVLLLLWQILHIGAQETQLPRPVVNIRAKRADIDPLACFRESGSGNLLNYNIKETDPTGTIIGYIPLGGIADGENATISLSLNEDSGGNHLRIDPENKTLVLAEIVDRDGPYGRSQLTATLQCYQIGGFPFPLDYTIQVVVAGVNDNTPMFIGLPYEVSIPELTKVGTTVFKGFEAIDDDGESRDGQVIYSIEPYAEDPDSYKWFTIHDAGRREITLERQLDYETKQQWLVLLQARDNGNPEFNYNYTVITINVLDGNDLPPIYVPCNITNITVEDCTNLTYSATILERTPVAEPLDFYPGPIYAVDADENVTNAEPIFYTLYRGTPSNYADYLSINSSSGDVMLLKPVCYNDIQRFDIEIKASEGPLPNPHNSSAFLAIGVLERNEHSPEFNETDYIGYVYENSPEGTQVKMTRLLQEPLRIAAIDEDMDATCGTSLMYSLHDSSGSFILMEQEADSAYVVTNRELDRENQASYTLSVVAVELNTEAQKESQPTTVTVIILDRNDNAPQFVANQYSTESNRYKIEIRENHPVEAAVMILHIADPDSPASDWVDFSFEYVSNPSGSPPFAMKRTGNTSVAIVLVLGTHLIRGESHVVSLQATDGMDDTLKSAVAYVEIEILKSNDTHAPRFSEEIFTATASEGLPVNTYVTTVTATDPDEETLTYSITAGNEDGTFEIDPTSGEIKIIKELDREMVPTYTINVTAFDGNLSASAYLIVTVLDINDNNPQFNMSWPHTFLVLEGNADEFVGQVMAYDIDEKGTANSEIRYSLTSDYFKINAETGSIYTKVALDREQQDRYDVSVVATDNAAAARSSNLMVTVIVQDVNDNGPAFEQTEYTVELTEEAVITDFLTLKALDLDESAVLEYSITAGDTSIFSINRTSGKMSLLQPLDYELAKEHNITVMVTDVEINRRENNSTAKVMITVTDINDHRPVFTQSEYQGAILRTADLATVVVDNIVATDGDMPTSPNGQVQYNINPPNEWFFIPEASRGAIVTKRSLENAPDSFNLTVIARDLGTPAIGAKAYVIIDVRLEKPIFPDPILRVNSLMEGQPAGSHVVDVEAVANVGDQIMYSIISDDQNLFRIESIDNMGKIFTNEVLDREMISVYTIDVEATLNNESTNTAVTDQRRRKRATDTNVVEVIIELGDVNDNAPRFLQDKYFIGVSQDAGVSTTIITMQALDSDSGNNSAIMYSLEATSSNNDKPLMYFTIDSESGIIATLQQLPQTEKATKYEVKVIAKEKFSSEHEPATTIVSIALITNEYRAVLVGMVPPDLTEANHDVLVKTLQQLLDALVFVEDVSQRHYGKDLDQIDPSGSDTTFYAINTTSGLPLEADKIINDLEDNQKELNAFYSSIVSNGTWVETRHVAVGRGGVIGDSEPTIEAIALICLGIVLFVACVLAIIVIIISWKKREMEREKQARVYLPMYSGFNPYANNDDLEMGNENLDEGLFASANPVYFDDQSVQVGAPPNFLQEAEVQEATMDFPPEESDDEANAVANSIAAACVGSEKSSFKDVKGDTYPPSSGPPSYTSQENAPTLPNLVYEADSLPRKTPPHPDRPPPPTPPSAPPPPPPPSKPPAYDNPGVDITDETDNRTNSTVTASDLPTTQPRTDSLPHEDKQAYSPSKEGSFQSGRSSVEPKELQEPNGVHLTKIYKPPSIFDTPSTNSTLRDHSPTGVGNHIGGADTGHGKGDRSKELPNGNAWEPDEVLTTAL